MLAQRRRHWAKARRPARSLVAELQLRRLRFGFALAPLIALRSAIHKCKRPGMTFCVASFGIRECGHFARSNARRRAIRATHSMAELTPDVSHAQSTEKKAEISSVQRRHNIRSTMNSSPPFPPRDRASASRLVRPADSTRHFFLPDPPRI